MHREKPQSTFHGKMAQKRQILYRKRNDYRSSVFSASALNKLVSSVGYFCLTRNQVVQKVICSMNPTKLENLKFLTVTS